jgi:hypothetical protein
MPMSRVDASRAVLVHCSATHERRTARAIDLMRIDDSDVPAMYALTSGIEPTTAMSVRFLIACRGSHASVPPRHCWLSNSDA